jgi:hypothetical protein
MFQCIGQVRTVGGRPQQGFALVKARLPLSPERGGEGIEYFSLQILHL